MLVAAGCLAFVLVCLLVEYRNHERRLRSIPLRIAVTGTRGKSSVTRLIASCLREAGITVVAKTTGSRAVLILPDGTEEDVRRRGAPSILEAKKLVQKASSLRARALVSELMSIQPECIHVEATRLLEPRVLVITNIRPDHLAQMGSTRESVPRCLATALADGMTAFLPEEESSPILEESARRVGAHLKLVPRDDTQSLLPSESGLPWLEHSQNLRLSLAVAESLGIDRETAFRAMRKARPDLGALKVWSVEMGRPARRWYLVSLFAANDPQSTRQTLSRLEEVLPFGRDVIGLLNLRRDRGDRTLQWAEALRAGEFPELRKVFLIGDHAHAFCSRTWSPESPGIEALEAKNPEAILTELAEKVPGEVAVVGMGNMGGLGVRLVEHWAGIGEGHDF